MLNSMAEPQKTPDKVYRVNEAALKLGVSRKRMYDWIRDKRITAFRAHGLYWITASNCKRPAPLGTGGRPDLVKRQCEKLGVDYKLPPVERDKAIAAAKKALGVKKRRRIKKPKKKKYRRTHL